MNIEELTPVEYVEEEGIWLKRDDLFEVYGVRGGKSRAAYQVVSNLLKEGYKTIVTAGSRQSPQCEIVSFICESLGVDCVLFMPTGANTSVIDNIEKNKHTRIERVRPGYNNVIIARSRDYAKSRGYGYVPFGMECEENVEITSKQVRNIPFEEIKSKGGRLVIPVGSGMSFSSIVTGIYNEYGESPVPILGVQVGKNPTKIISTYAEGLDFMDYLILASEVDYHTAVQARVGSVVLDPIYEAKCRNYLRSGDCLWIVGRRVMKGGIYFGNDTNQ